MTTSSNKDKGVKKIKTKWVFKSGFNSYEESKMGHIIKTTQSKNIQELKKEFFKKFFLYSADNKTAYVRIVNEDVWDWIEDKLNQFESLVR